MAVLARRSDGDLEHELPLGTGLWEEDGDFVGDADDHLVDVDATYGKGDETNSLQPLDQPTVQAMAFPPLIIHV